eukprot:gene23770-26902_t
MSIRNFNSLFDPGSVAVIGASLRPGSLGAMVLANMAGGGYAGALWPVNPKYDELLGVRCYGKVSALPKAPDLAIICTVAGLIAELGARGTRAAVVLTKGLDEARVGGKPARQAMLDAAKPHLLRILGPGGVGLLAPHSGLNASLAEGGARAGKIAFISQSDALMAAVLDWARLHGIGFSKFASLGERADIDLGDLLDYLADDADTAAILVYMENLACARKFMSAARLAARAKPVIVLKAGRDSSDQAYDAAFRRAGMLRVHFEVYPTLAKASNASNRIKTSQFAFPNATSTATRVLRLALGASQRLWPALGLRLAYRLFGTPLPAAQVIDFLRVYLSKKLAQRIIMHGVFMDVLGVGVLITGDSGLGKSELGLELISRSHGLVADDAVEFARIAPNMIEGRCPALLQNLLEVRGLGLLDIKAIFGETAVRRKMRLKLIVHLVRRSALEEEVERLPFQFPTEDVLGLPIRKVVIPVAAGRNIAVLLEAAVRNTILQLRGIDTLQEFMERQRQAMSGD